MIALAAMLCRHAAGNQPLQHQHPCFIRKHVTARAYTRNQNVEDAAAVCQPSGWPFALKTNQHGAECPAYIIYGNITARVTTAVSMICFMSCFQKQQNLL